MSNTGYRAVIKSFIRKERSATEITKELADVYGNSASSYRTVARWLAEFKDPIRDLEDALRSCRLPNALTDENIRAIEGVVMCDRQVSVQRVVDELDISKTLLYEIISDYLRMKKICTRWVPKLLTPLQLADRVDCCEEFLENCNQDPIGFFLSYCYGWIHHCDPPSQQEANT